MSAWPVGPIEVLGHLVDDHYANARALDHPEVTSDDLRRHHRMLHDLGNAGHTHDGEAP